MDFKFTEEQETFRQEVRNFLEEELRQGSFKPICDAWIQGYSIEFTKKVAQRGWIGLSWPKEYGGQGRSNVDRFVLTEEMLRYGAPAACHWFADRQIGGSIIAFGTKEQKQELLPKILRGEAYVGLGMSEPEAGSDLASLQTRATEDGDDYIIDGQKMWTSCARFMNYIYLVARTDPEVPKHRGISEFVIPANLPGITIKPTIDITGSEGIGFIMTMNVLDRSRPGIGAQAVGLAQGALEAAVDYAQQRIQFGHPIISLQAVQHMLADMAIQVEAARALIYAVARTIDSGAKQFTEESAMAKVFASDVAMKVTTDAVQILGGAGYMRDYPVEKMMRDAKITQIYEGANEVLRSAIASELRKRKARRE